MTTPATLINVSTPGEVIWDSRDRAYGWHVALAARDHLTAKAERLEARAIRIELDTGIPPGPELVGRAGVWHDQRAQGARERAERVDRCQQREVMRVSCTGCGTYHDRPVRCDCGLLCVSCRGHRKTELQRDFLRARAEVIARSLAGGLLRGSLPGGRYSEKFLTLTLPHVDRHDVGERIRVAFEAWRRFGPMLSGLMRGHESTYFPEEPSVAKGGLRRWWHFRRFEWTPGGDAGGNPHFHVWLMCPFLDQDLLRDLWRTALSRVRTVDGQARAFTPAELAGVLLPHIEEVRRDISKELIKYITKDWAEDGKRLAPHVYAEVFKALDGRRLTQASSGFMALAEVARQCPDCKEYHPATVDIRRAAPGELEELRAERRRARAPPVAAGAPGELVSVALLFPTGRAELCTANTIFLRLSTVISSICHLPARLVRRVRAGRWMLSGGRR